MGGEREDARVEVGAVVRDGTESENDQEELAKASPRRESLREESTGSSVCERSRVGRIGDGHQESTEDLDESDWDEESDAEFRRGRISGDSGAATDVVERELGDEGILFEEES